MSETERHLIETCGAAVAAAVSTCPAVLIPRPSQQRKEELIRCFAIRE